MASSGHLRRCSDADTTNKCRSREKMLPYYHGKLQWVTLEAVDCRIHSVRYDIAVNREAGGNLRCFIRSPTTL
eukprot:scaffold18363_cov105-Skeletonema_dohrnii-CCMP3373.AAC.3